MRHSPRTAAPLNSTSTLRNRRATAWVVFVMTQATEADLSTPRQKPDLLGIAFLAAIGIVMLGWITGLVWAAIAFMNWLVA